jgi:hypothetical protein
MYSHQYELRRCSLEVLTAFPDDEDSTDHESE